MQNRRQIQRNRDSVASLVRGVLFCGRQDIALRGHRESDKEAACAEEHSDSDEDELSVGSQRAACSNRGNFRELLNLMKLENAEIRARFDSLPKNANYTSKDSQNEMLHAANCLIREQILTEVNNDGGIYFWIADEARDTSCSEKMSICIRYLHGVVVNARRCCKGTISWVRRSSSTRCSLADILNSQFSGRHAPSTEELCRSSI